MERSWWWKAIGIFFLTIIAAVYLAPTVVGKRLPPWYTKYVKGKLQLGLDLQGGIHLVYEVEIDKAVSDKADRLAADLENRLAKEKKVAVKLIREGRDDIVISFARPADLKVMDKKLMAEYRNNLTEIEREEGKGTVRLRMDENYIKEVEDYALRQGIETIRGRVDKFGVAEPTIIAKGKDIVVELPGLTTEDFDRVKRVIGRTAQLEFKICDDGSKFMEQVAAKVPAKSPIQVRNESYDGKQKGTVSYTFLQKAGDVERVFMATPDQQFAPGTLPPEFSLAAGHQLMAGQSVPLETFPEGQYRLQVKVTDNTSGASTMSDVVFSVQ